MSLYVVLKGLLIREVDVDIRVLSDLLADRYELPPVHLGDLFRAMKTQDTPLAREVQELMKAGNLIPDSVTNRIIEERLKKTDAQKGAIFYNYPRTVEQAMWLDAFLAGHHARISVVVLLELEVEIAVQRHQHYIENFNPLVSGHIDRDKETEFFRKRMAFYQTGIEPLVSYYRERGLLKTIDAAQDEAQISADVIAAVEARKS